MGQELIRQHVVRHLPDVDLAHRQVGGVGVCVSASVPNGGELRDCDATINPLAGFLEGDESVVDVLEGDEARLGGGWSHPPPIPFSLFFFFFKIFYIFLFFFKKKNDKTVKTTSF
jgi:hypothetical protein